MFSQTLLMFIKKYSVRPQREYLIICLESVKILVGSITPLKGLEKLCVENIITQ